MRINSVNSVNQNQQRSQNFGMAVRFEHPEIPFKIAEKFDAQGIAKFNTALAKLTQEQSGNKLTDILFRMVSTVGEMITLDVRRMPDATRLRSIYATDEAYKTLAGPDGIIKMMEDAGALANSYSGLTETAKGITIVGT